MLDKFISEYANPDLVRSTLSRSSSLEKLAFEFCTRFNTKLMEHSSAAGPGTPRVNVVSPEGIAYGTLRVDKDSDGEFYAFTSTFVKKERSSKRSDHRTRDASKISTLLRVIEKNGDLPTGAATIERLTGGLRYAFRSTDRGTGTHVRVDHITTIAMMEYILKINEENLTNKMDVIQNAYEEYREEKEKLDRMNTTHNRFAEGSTAIAIFTNMGKPFYVVIDAEFVNGEVKLTSEPKRYRTLSEAPELVADVTIIRAFFETNKHLYDMGNNDLGVPRRDQYYEEIDICSGYSESDLHWVIIPKKAP